MSSGRPNYGSWMPTKDFEDNIEGYRFNRFLYIGIDTRFSVFNRIMVKFRRLSTFSLVVQRNLS